MPLTIADADIEKGTITLVVQKVGLSSTKLCALNENEYAYASELATHTEFLELASLPEFQDCYVDCLTFEEDEE